MRPNKSLLEALIELQTLDRVPRTGYLLRGVSDPESVSEHSWHLVFLVWSLAPRCPGINAHRAMELALVHDVAEVRTGDLPATASRYFPAGAKTQGETAALDEILAPLGDRARHLFAEYQEAATREARLVKACDKLQMMLKVYLYESWGHEGLAEFWDHPWNFPGSEFDAVQELFEELLEKRRLRQEAPGQLQSP